MPDRSDIIVPESALHLVVGQSLQNLVDEAGPGATIVIDAGLHVGQSASPVSGQRFVGLAGAVLDGDGAPFAFRSSASSVTIEGLEITDYQPPSRDAAIHAEEGGSEWIVQGNEVHGNGETGVRVVSGSIVRGNSIHHNDRYGMNGSGSDLVVEGNEIACNALEGAGGGELGGTKFVHTTDLLLHGNEVHHNLGNGLWLDINNIGAVVEGNSLVANDLAGVFVEISCGGTVRENYLEANGFGTDRLDGVQNAAIYISNSPGVEVVENTLEGNFKSIGAIHWEHPNRDAVDRCDPSLQNLWVHENTMKQSEGFVAGIEATIDRPQVWDSWGNRFESNDYEIGSAARFRWEGETLRADQWVEHVQGS